MDRPLVPPLFVAVVYLPRHPTLRLSRLPFQITTAITFAVPWRTEPSGCSDSALLAQRWSIPNAGRTRIPVTMISSKILRVGNAF